LDALGHPSPSDEQLERYIGPPLRASFALLLNTNDVQLIERAVELYRQRFASEGMFENSVYPGIENALATLRMYDVQLYVTTSKPTVFATQILEHFGLERYFKQIYGSELDGTRTDKGELVAHVLAEESISASNAVHVLAEESISASNAVMIGDREHDVKGALANGVTPVGVLWGYGTRQELTAAGAILLAENPESLVKVLKSSSPQQGTPIHSRP
jgi:phosphoglycolate phosphatase